VKKIKEHIAGLTIGDESCEKVCPNGLVLFVMHLLLTTTDLINHDSASRQDGWLSTSWAARFGTVGRTKARDALSCAQRSRTSW
jgi:hypothetical protein